MDINPIPRRTVRRNTTASISARLASLLALALLLASDSAAIAQDSSALAQGQPAERDLAEGQTHNYQIALLSGQFVEVAVDQRGINLAAALYDADNKRLAGSNRVAGTKGSERILWIAEQDGSFRLEVRAVERTASAGKYQARIESLRQASSQDRTRLAAQSAYLDSLQMLSQTTVESFRKAAEKLEESARLWLEAGDHSGRGYALLSLANVNYDLRNLDKSLGSLNDALPLFKSLGDEPGQLQAVNLTGTVYLRLGEMQRAIDNYTELLRLSRSLGDRLVESTALNNIALVYDRWGERQNALNFYNQSLAINRAIGFPQGAALRLRNIGVVYAGMGDWQAALDNYNEAFAIYQSLNDRGHQADMLNNIGLIYYYLGDNQSALTFLNQSLEGWKALGTGTVSEQATALNNIANIYASIDDAPKAIEFYNQSLRLRPDTPNDRRWKAITLVNLGKTYQDMGDAQKAIEYCNQSLPLWQATGERQGQAAALTSLGLIYNSEGDNAKAFESLQPALQMSREVADRPGEALTLYALARVERDRGNLAEARPHIEAAIEIIESLRDRIGSQELRASYFVTVQKYYSFYTDLLMQMNKRDPQSGLSAEALQSSERARARTLLEMLAEAGVDIRQGIDLDLLARERALQQVIVAKSGRLTRMLVTGVVKEQISAARKEIDQMMLEYQKVQASIRAASPRYAALTQPQPLSLKDIQQRVLDQDTLFLEYSLGEERSYLWVVSPTSLSSFELPKEADIEKAAQLYYKLLIAADQRRAGTQTDSTSVELAEVGAALSRMLIEPAASLLGNKRLLIVADGALHYIPFSALPASSARQKEYRPLIVDHEIVTLPSASTLAVLRQDTAGRKPAEKTLAVLADPVFTRDERIKAPGAATKEETRSATRGLRIKTAKAEFQTQLGTGQSGIPRLPGTREEAREILSLVDESESLAALDFAASRETATSGELSRYRYVHFATHGLLDTRHPNLSGIVLSLIDEKGQEQDGFLLAHEIYNLQLPAELVVLSACRTGLGKQMRGEGVMGLTRGLMYAGAARVVVSLWDVADEPTARLMARFYRQMLKRNQRPAEALRAAQVYMWKKKRFAAPYNWAAFVLQGEYR
jgi:CHAT domain-containing protein/tetratricopeptide (TPR) repeat protein